VTIEREIPPTALDLRCCTTEQYRDWKELANIAHPDPQVGFCEDCTPEYALRMRSDGLCVRPKIIFFRRAAETWLRRTGQDGGRKSDRERYGYEHPPGEGEVIGGYRADQYTFIDVLTGESKTVRDQRL
jgi:hypothetical protein